MFAICIEASHERGMGHVYRALALSSALDKLSARPCIYVNNSPAALQVLQARGASYRVVPLYDAESNWEEQRVREDGIKIWINDRLDTTEGHARKVRSAGAEIVTIDDLGSGAALARVNVMAFPPADRDIEGDIVLKGPSYLILDPEIAKYRRRRQSLGSIVVSMGGSDTYGVTIPIVEALQASDRSATVILGPAFAHHEALAKITGSTIRLKQNVASLAAEFFRHDLAITAGGITPCEANAAGLPAIVVATEPWEERTGKILASLGGAIFAGARQDIDLSCLRSEIPIAAMSEAALSAVPVDGAQRLAQVLIAL